jgi:hypothetical protein
MSELRVHDVLCTARQGRRVRGRHVQLLLSVLLGLAMACVAKPGGQTSQPVTAEPVRTEPIIFVEATPDPTRAKPSSSEPVAEPPNDAQLEEAKRLFEHAVQAFEAGDIAGAVEKFREAYLLAPLPALLFNIARGQEQLGDIVGACESYETAKADPAADEGMREAASERLTQLNCP